MIDIRYKVRIAIGVAAWIGAVVWVAVAVPEMLMPMLLVAIASTVFDSLLSNGLQDVLSYLVERIQRT